ncbi:hypothetical protein D3C87_1581490 [compost metagenome]
MTPRGSPLAFRTGKNAWRGLRRNNSNTESIASFSKTVGSFSICLRMRISSSDWLERRARPISARCGKAGCSSVRKVVGLAMK